MKIKVEIVHPKGYLAADGKMEVTMKVWADKVMSNVDVPCCVGGVDSISGDDLNKLLIEAARLYYNETIE